MFYVVKNKKTIAHACIAYLIVNELTLRLDNILIQQLLQYEGGRVGFVRCIVVLSDQHDNSDNNGALGWRVVHRYCSLLALLLLLV